MAAPKNIIEHHAQRLREAQATRSAIGPLREELPDGDLALAYAIQQANTDHGVAHGRRIVGRKIGLTSQAVQKQLGVDQPDFGTLFADMIFGDDEELPMSRLLQPKVETEIALVLERDLDNEDTTLIELINAVAYVLPAIEVVDSRIANWNIKFFDTVSDNASSGLVVLGGVPTKLNGLDLKLCQMSTERGAPGATSQVSSGTGAACLGHPLVAAVWLARKLAGLGQALRAGDLVMTGALGPMVAAQPGERFEAHISGVGSVRTRFSA